MFKSKRIKSTVANAIKSVGTADLSQGLTGKSFALDDVSVLCLEPLLMM